MGEMSRGRIWREGNNTWLKVGSVKEHFMKVITFRDALEDKKDFENWRG